MIYQLSFNWPNLFVCQSQNYFKEQQHFLVLTFSIFMGHICVCSCAMFRFLWLTPLLTPTNLVTSDVTLSQSQSNSPLPPIVDPQVGSATKLPWPFPVLANIHLSQHIPQTSFSNFQWYNWVQASSLLICTFQYSPLQLLEISFVFHRYLSIEPYLH